MNFPTSPMFLLAVHGMLVLLAALAGGALPNLLRLTQTRLPVAVRFVAGLMLGLSLAGQLHQPFGALASTTLMAATGAARS